MILYHLTLALVSLLLLLFAWICRHLAQENAGLRRDVRLLQVARELQRARIRDAERRAR